MTEETEPAGRAAPAASGVWSKGDTDRLIEMWGTRSRSEIAEALGRSPSSVSVKATRLQLTSRRQRSATEMEALPPRKTAKIRPCLSCRSMFYSEGSHNRICDPCKGGTSWNGNYAIRLGGS